jgi:endonuclease/exonuclease/phosphatase family metal-dependent hydrolase
MRNLIIVLLFIASPVFAQPVKVMTYNLRLDTESDGVNQWGKRKEKVFALIRKYDPDIFGVQEALHNQMQDLANNLKDYVYFGVGRDDGKEKGEYSAIFIRKKRFTIIEQNTFWLSKTPEVPGSKDWDASITRVATWGKLRDKKTKKTFLMMNTHFDHRGEEARLNSAKLIKERAAQLAGDLPAIITGDFNFPREAPPYEAMMSSTGLQLVDSSPNTPPTFCGFKVAQTRCVAIDYIFHTAHWTSSNYQVITDNDGTYYPSDHLPVIVSLSLK